MRNTPRTHHIARLAPHTHNTALAKRHAALAKRPRPATRELFSPQRHSARDRRRREAPTRDSVRRLTGP